MIVEVNKTQYCGIITNRIVTHINTDYIVSMCKNEDNVIVYMVDGHAYDIDLESFEKIKNLMEMFNE